MFGKVREACGICGPRVQTQLWGSTASTQPDPVLANEGLFRELGAAQGGKATRLQLMERRAQKANANYDELDAQSVSYLGTPRGSDGQVACLGGYDDGRSDVISACGQADVDFSEVGSAYAEHLDTQRGALVHQVMSQLEEFEAQEDNEDVKSNDTGVEALGRRLPSSGPRPKAKSRRNHLLQNTRSQLEGLDSAANALGGAKKRDLFVARTIPASQMWVSSVTYPDDVSEMDPDEERRLTVEERYDRRRCDKRLGYLRRVLDGVEDGAEPLLRNTASREQQQELSARVVEEKRLRIEEYRAHIVGKFEGLGHKSVDFRDGAREFRTQEDNLRFKDPDRPTMDEVNLAPAVRRAVGKYHELCQQSGWHWAFEGEEPEEFGLVDSEKVELKRYIADLKDQSPLAPSSGMEHDKNSKFTRHGSPWIPSALSMPST